MSNTDLSGHKNVEGEGSVKSSLIDVTDLWLTIFILIGCGFSYWATTQFETVPDLFAQDVGPAFFPRLLIWTIVVLTLALPFEHLLLKRKGVSLAKERSKRIEPMTFFTALLLFAIVSSITWLGTSLSMFAGCLTLPLLWGERRPMVLLPYAVLLPLAVTILFSLLLGVHFEPGIFGISLR